MSLIQTVNLFHNEVIILTLPSKNQNERYTFKDYLSWPEEERWEIIDGMALMQAQPTVTHQAVSMELSRQFANYLIGKPCRVFHAPFAVRLPKGNEADEDIETVVEPDLVVICDSSKIDEKKGCKGAPDLIVEILSPTTGKRDRLIKFNKYESAGVKEYWLVDPTEKLVSIFRLNENRSYGRPEIFSQGLVQVGIFSDLAIDFNLVFPSDTEENIRS